MRHKPWPIILMGLLYILAPIGNILVSAWIHGIWIDRYLELLFRYRSVFDILQLFVLYPIAGVAVLSVKKWSIPVFLVISGWSLWSSYDEFVRFSLYSGWILAAVYTVNILFVVFILIPQVRVAYLDPRLRWWESLPRFEFVKDATIESEGKTIPVKTSDLSRGGVFVLTGDTFPLDSQVRIQFGEADQSFVADARVAHHVPGKGYGIQFAGLNSSQKSFLKATARRLDREGVPRRPERVPFIMGLLMGQKRI